MQTNGADLNNPVKLLEQLDLPAIERRLEELEKERRALIVLARSARALDKRAEQEVHRRKTTVTPGEGVTVEVLPIVEAKAEELPSYHRRPSRHSR